MRHRSAILAAVFLLLAAPTMAAAATWAAAWSSPPFPALGREIPKHIRFYENQTVRQVVRAGLAGRRLRVRLTNELGTTPLRAGAVHVALSDVDGTLRPGTDRVVTFSGQRAVTIRQGAPLVSDPVDLPVRPFDEVAVSVYYPDRVEAAAHHLNVLVSTPGDFTGAVRLDGATAIVGAALASRLEVEAGAAPRRVIVAFGDSITEGAGSTAKAHKSWPDQFAARLAANQRYAGWTVINAGISGNRVLWDGAGPNALARFDRDVLDVPGATDVVVLEGINDIGWGHRPDSLASADDLIAAYRQMIARAHARGLRIYAGTLLPFQGAVYYTPEGEADRQTVNRWIRTSHELDGVIDFETPMMDPANRLKIRAGYQIGDNLHPNDAGYTVMAGAIDPRVFERR